MPYSIRPASEADLPRILEIYESARQFMAASGNPTQWGSHYPDPEIVRGDLDSRHLYVCTENDSILGVFCYFFGEDQDYLQIYNGAWLNDRPYGVVHRIAVASGTKGVGSACLDFALSRCGNLRIDTHRDNIPMQKLLAKNGFHPCGIIHCHHGGERIAYQKSTL